MISACSALTDSTITSSDLLPVQDASDSTNAKKITLENLTTYIGANIPYGAKIQTGSYIGTGVYGSGNPNSITVDFAPKLVWCAKEQIYLGNYMVSSGGAYYCGLILTDQLTTAYQSGYGFGSRSSGSSGSSGISLYAKISADGKTISWYASGDGSDRQNNSRNTTYYWLAIG